MLCSARVGSASPDLLDPAHYGDHARPVDAGGRQAAWFVEKDGWHGVLRGYRRGGLVARLSREAYIWQGESRTRSFREYRLLAWMREQGLNVPAPLAAAYWRHGLTYRAAILVERIPDVRPLAHLLDEPVWEAAARAIAAMHRAGVWHADLNAFNILLDAQGLAWLIDFDRGTQGGVSESQRRANLLRLRRSLEKVGGERGLECWERLERSYQALY
ncbi:MULTISPECIES: 3-deoxy-D-manno-octulosonic acid kinase [unclassified Bordetella]|uniref:3-deoxy-D-manno-octulosonic acid kinase n=1 Tax=unclassified Bordetella TaxID=2630031 RepID=UPI0013277E66|nr:MULTISPECIES: 3-deoxy-D-manno-octulosonic acid kinase [unclassified Bordetella]MVW72275.1 3-deoxy-D-manno-octulosonic acid kinase [Bordetella sp. 15P40C-2]MVW78934.1 3-deoxy-D-manno-octulosonic acid kinase [Bordetella sp. 02P26C-1]